MDTYMEDSLVEALNAVYLVSGVHGERYTVQTLSANHAGEAGRVIRLAGGSQYSIQYRSDADTTLLQGVEIVLLAVRLAFQRVEGLSLQIDLTHEAAEAAYMENLVHRRAPGAFSLDLAPTLRANTINVAIFAVISHPLNQQISEHVDLRRDTGIYQIRYAIVLSNRIYQGLKVTSTLPLLPQHRP